MTLIVNQVPKSCVGGYVPSMFTGWDIATNTGLGDLEVYMVQSNNHAAIQ
jgi:hypothetical protein